MPAYDYGCTTCGHRFEVRHGIHADGPETCPACGATTIRKLMTTPAVHFRGSGWAKMERRAAPAANRSGGSGDDGADGGGQGESPSTGTESTSSAPAVDAPASPDASPARPATPAGPASPAKSAEGA